MKVRFISLAAGLVIANFAYQAATAQEWGRAIERSWFQMVALILAYFAAV